MSAPSERALAWWNGTSKADVLAWWENWCAFTHNDPADILSPMDGELCDGWEDAVLAAYDDWVQA